MTAVICRVYELELERAYLRTAVAAIANDTSATDGMRANSAAELVHVEGQVAELRASGNDAGGRMAAVAARLGMAADEIDFVWTCVAAVADPRLSLHAVALGGTDAKRGMSLGLYSLISSIDAETSRRLALRFAAGHPMMAYRLLRFGDPQAVVVANPIAASSRFVSYLAGDDSIDGFVASAGGVVPMPEVPCYDEAQTRALERLTEGLAGREPLVISIEGPFAAGRKTAVAAVAARTGREAVFIDLKRVAGSSQAIEEAVGALLRECVLREAIPVIAELDDLVGGAPEGDTRMRTLGRVLDSFPVTVVVTGNQHGIELPLTRRMLRVEWPVADTATRRKLWQSYLPADAVRLASELDSLALRYRLGAGGIERAASTAGLIARSTAASEIGAPHLVAGVRNNIAERLGSLATRIEVKQSWDDLVLSPDTIDQIQALIARVRRAHEVYEDWGFNKKAARGIGVPALFSGPPGTGKTMVAGIIARELDLELLQVDLSQVVSKWIGETEKQLGKVFDAAEAGHALLLFDEADSLFAKRTEVKGATDRYANLEVNYLLQRVEAFGGITVLTTNLDASIDKALKRRLAGHIVFWPPDEDEREDLWQRLLDTGAAPLAGDLQYAELARAYPDMTGANIRNAILAAAFLASAESSAITQAHLVRAANGEYRTMGRVLR
ncbi:MAG TPA: ATP-binding protein [Kofleriaceae bacterium]|nr:ATP-binding protein [Kofleriaceae bacterium]